MENGEQKRLRKIEIIFSKEAQQHNREYRQVTSEYLQQQHTTRALSYSGIVFRGYAVEFL